jgi:5-methylcytosine-specific restriction endonuclease McrA
MGFNAKEVAKLLYDCKRRCCICHRFCGIKIETDHITPISEGGAMLHDSLRVLVYANSKQLARSFD